MAATEKKGTYSVLSNLHHADDELPKGRLFRKGDTVRLSEEHAAPLLKSKVVERAK
jgi:hypothetical protein